METIGTDRSLLLVHAHPDDESIFTGATMAKYAAEGARVTLVTCTMGERGVNRLAGPGAGGGVHLAGIRAQELKMACAALGVTDHRFLGGPGRWCDSGPAGAASNADPRSFCGADAGGAANELVALIREVRPQVIVTYDANGFYGHPDHIQAYRVARHAYQLACDPERTKFYATTMPRSIFTEATRHPGPPGAQGVTKAPRHRRIAGHMGAPDEDVSTEIDAAAYLDAKMAALRAHATQIVVKEPFFHAAGLIPLPALGTEYYTLLAGPDGAVAAGQDRGREDDLFSGV